MLHSVRISSKRQIAIPTAIFKAAKLQQGDILTIRLEKDSIIFEHPKNKLLKLAGSLKVPLKYKNKTIDDIITDAKTEYFLTKSQL